MSERRNDPSTRDRIGYLQAGWERAMRLMWAAMVLLYVAAAVYGFGLWQARGDIQESRREATARACRETNARHDRTISQYNREVAALLERTDDPAQRARIRANVGANVRLIDALAPRRPRLVRRRGRLVAVGATCDEYARNLTEAG